jgi:hypothetical protein
LTTFYHYRLLLTTHSIITFTLSILLHSIFFIFIYIHTTTYFLLFLPPLKRWCQTYGCFNTYLYSCV